MSTEQSDQRIFQVTPEVINSFKRLDQWLASINQDLSRSTIKRLFEGGLINSSDDIKLELKKLPPLKTFVEIEIPPPISTDLVAQDLNLEVIHEDEHLIIINKPQGMCVHPAPGHPDQTLVNGILHLCPDLQGVGGERRPGIVHRLDLGTSGVMVVAKNQKTHEGLVDLFSHHDIERRYLALTWGIPHQLSGMVKTFIARNPSNRLKMSSKVKRGKVAITHYQVLKHKNNIALSELKLETGRTHQIRVHLASELLTPILCDPLYGDSKKHLKKLPPEIQDLCQGLEFQMLHAKVLGFKHPITKEKLYFETPPPSPFQKVLDLL